jgi:hypothetical protein
VGWQQPLPVFAHYADAAHRDVPMPAPWSWDHKAHDFPQPYSQLRGGCAKPWRQRRDQLYFRGGCNGPTRGWRGPIWRFYPRKAANLLSHARPAELDGGVYDHCDSPKLNKHEWGWDEQMTREMEREAPKKKIEPFANNCNYRRRLAALHRGSAARLPACLLTLRACWPPRQVLATPSQVLANPSQVPAAHRRERGLLPPRLRVPRGQHRLQAGLLALTLTLTPDS